MFGGDGGAGREAQRARNEELARQGRISRASSETRQKFRDVFSDDYYAQELAKFQKAYAPDVQRQHANALEQLQAALMRSGLFESSVAARKSGEAAEALQGAKNEVTARGLAAQANRKLDVAGAENTVIGQLVNTADAGAAFENAASAIRTNTSTTPTPMLGQVFTDLTAGLATQADLERSGQARYNVLGRIPGWGTSGSRYTRNVG